METDSADSDGVDPSMPPGVSIGAQMLQQALERQLFGEAPPVRLGRFSVLELLGKGGMGAVYAAYDPDLDRRVAVKVLHSKTARGSQSAARLRREAQALARLNHPHVMTVHEVGVHEGAVFVAMEYVAGGTLDRWADALEPGPARFTALCARMRECVAGLSAAHAAGIVHRDFKPANVLIDDEGRARVADFGLARADAVAGDSADPMPPPDPALVVGRLTLTAQLLGTPAYMAPEQFEGHADARSDQFSLCATFFELLYRKRPFAGATAAELALNVQDGNLQEVGETEVPEWMFALLSRGLQPDPQDRFADLEALAAALRQQLRPRRSKAPILGALGLSAAAIAVAWPRADAGVGGPSASPCMGERDALEAVWGEQRRDAVRTAFEATQHRSLLGYWERVDTRLERWSDAWSDASRASCEATNVLGTQTEAMHTLRTACMIRLRDTAAALTQRYTEVTPETIAATSNSSLQLPPIAQCADRDNLVFAGGTLDLSSPAVQRFYDLYAQYRPLADAGRNAEAELYLYEAALHAAEHGLPRLASDAYRNLATLMYRVGDLDEAEAIAKVALDHAQRSGHGDEIVRAWLRLASIAEVDDRPDDRAFFVERAVAIAEGFAVPGETIAAVFAMRARIAKDAGDDAEAARLYLQSFGILDRLGVHQFQAVADLASASLSLYLSGNTDDALETGERALAMSRELFGPSNSDTLGSAAQLAQFYAAAGQTEEALRLTSEVAANMPSHARPRWRITALAAHANMLVVNDRTEEGLALFATLLNEAEALNAAGRTAAQIRVAYATALSNAERYHEAESLFESLLADEPQSASLTPVQHATLQLNYAMVLSKTDRATAALPYLDTALARLQNNYRPVGRGRIALIAGEILANAGLPARARVAFEDGLQAAEGEDAEPERVAEIRRQLAALPPAKP
ncbi:MAG: protein kinase [Myxococcota bacterium]